MSEGSFWPKTWQDALPLLVWCVIIFACGFEGIASLLHAEWLQAVLGLGGMFGLTAMLIHWTRLRDNFADVRWLMAAIMVALIVGALSPYVEQRRWPFSTIIHDLATPDEIAKAAAPIQSKLDDSNQQVVRLQNELSAAQQEMGVTKRTLDKVRQDLAAAKEQTKHLSAGTVPAPPPPMQDRRLSREQLQILVNEFAALRPNVLGIIVYRSQDNRAEAQIYANDFMDAFSRAGLHPQADGFLPNGPDETGVMIGVPNPSNPPAIAEKLADALNKAAIENRFIKADGNLLNGFKFIVGPNPL